MYILKYDTEKYSPEEISKIVKQLKKTIDAAIGWNSDVTVIALPKDLELYKEEVE